MYLAKNRTVGAGLEPWKKVLVLVYWKPQRNAISSQSFGLTRDAMGAGT